MVGIITPKPLGVRDITDSEFRFEHQAFLHGCTDSNAGASVVSWRRISRRTNELEIMTFSAPTSPSDGTVFLPAEAQGVISEIRYEDIGCPAQDIAVGPERSVVPIFLLKDGSELRVPVGARVSKAIANEEYIFQTARAVVPADGESCGHISFTVAREDFYRVISETDE